MPTTPPPEQEQPATQPTAQPAQTAQPAASSSEQELRATKAQSRTISNLQKERLRMDKAEAAIFTRPGGGVFRGTLPDPGLSSAVPALDLDDADDELAALQLMVTSQDLPFGWEFDGAEAKLSDILVDISTRNMTPHERAAFMQSKRKELAEFFGNDVWEFHKPTGEEDPRRILKAKWVLKWTKNDDGTLRAKARLALQGFNVPDALSGAVPTASPTASRLARQMALQLAANNGWRLWRADVATAFLQGRPQERELYAKVPKDAAELMGIEPNTLMKFIKPMYGQVKRKFKFRKWIEDDKMDYCGSDLSQTPHWENPKSNSSETEVKMATYAKNLKPITIDQKSSDNTRELTIKEKRQLRGQLPAATAGAAKEANKTLRFYKQNPDVGLKMKKVGQAAAAGMGGLEFAKRCWAALIYDGVDITKDESTRMAGESALVVDAKALYDAAQKESVASFQGKRAGIEALALRERMEATITRWRRVSSERQYADGLAKIAARQLLADRLRYGRLQLKRDPNYTAAKKKTKEERQESIDHTRPVTSAATRKATTPFIQLAVFATGCCRSAARSGYDTKNENDGYGIVIWFA
ncbi:unnamed protein product, partial [Prorocentrum cordatum]